MDSIDITDSAFSLDFTDNKVLSSDIGGSVQTDYMTYIYIGLAALIILGGVYIFKMYQNNKNKVVLNDESMDCPGGFCMPNTSSI